MSRLRALIEQIVGAHSQQILNRINQLEKNMSQELVDAVNRIKISVNRIVQDAIAKLGQPDPDIAGAVTALNGLSDSLDAESNALETGSNASAGNAS